MKKPEDVINQLKTALLVMDTRHADCIAMTRTDVVGLLEILKAQDGPRVHSHWKCTDAYPHWLYCVNCYKKFVPNVDWIEQYNIPMNYCPNCGAIMGKEAKA